MRSWGIVGLIVLGLVGCTPRPAARVGEAPTDDMVLAGQIILPGDANANPGQAPAGQTPTPAPSETPYVPFAVDVSVVSDYRDLNVAPPPGELATYRYTAKVAALVTMSNGYRNRDVTWESSNPAMATVDSSGNVQGVGTAAGTVSIIAFSRDRRASGSVSLTVTNLGDAELTVD